jgi:hypothetical protein
MEHLTKEQVAERFPDPAADGERHAAIKTKIAKTLSKRGERKPKTPRPAVTYRAQRRSLARGRKWNPPMHRIGAEVQEGWSPSVELNRSDKWPRARTYSYAREISPFPERPVR